MVKNIIFILAMILTTIAISVIMLSFSKTMQPKYSISDIPICAEKIFGFGECAFPVNRSEKVILIAIDAFGWSTWEYAKTKGLPSNINAIAANGSVYKAETTYPSNTRAAFPVMVPDSFFDDLERNNLSATCIASEGFFNFTEICKKESTDAFGVMRIIARNLDRDRYTGDDDDVALETIEAIKSGNFSFVFVHLSVDSTCHNYGPYSDESMNDLYSTDDDVGKIYRAAEPGTTIIISADHGCHETRSGGNHGSSRSEDMEIPIIITVVP